MGLPDVPTFMTLVAALATSLGLARSTRNIDGRDSLSSAAPSLFHVHAHILRGTTVYVARTDLKETTLLSGQVHLPLRELAQQEGDRIRPLHERPQAVVWSEARLLT